MRRTFVLILVLGLAAATPSSVLAARDWTVTAVPDELTTGVSTAILLTVTNTSQTGPGIRCVHVEVPPGFAISSAAVVSIYGETSGQSFLGWTAVGPAGSVVAFKNTLAIAPLDEGDQAVFRITGRATSPGSMSWTADAADSPGLPLNKSCGVGAYPTLAVPFDVDPVTPTPGPTKTPKPTAPPTPRPVPTPAATTKSPSATANPGGTLEPGATPSGAAPSVELGSEPTADPDASVDPSTPGGTGTPSNALQLGGGRDGTGGPAAGGVDGVVLAALDRLPGGLLFLAFPAFLLGVPGLLLVVAMGAQAVGALAPLQLIRRRLDPDAAERSGRPRLVQRTMDGPPFEG